MRAYATWQEYLKHFPKTARYTLGLKIDGLIVDTIELIVLASTAPREQKLPILQRAVRKFDLVKFFLQVAWELKALDTKKYTALSTLLDPIGKMLGGWHRKLVQQHPAS